MKSIGLIEDLICELGVGKTTLQSIRLTSNPGDGMRNSVNVILNFTNAVYEEKVSKSLGRLALSELCNLVVFDEDANKILEEQLHLVDFNFLKSQQKILSCQITLFEDDHVTLPKLKAVLHTKTFYGLHSQIRRHIPAARVSIFYGAGGVPINIAEDQDLHDVYVKDNHPYTLITNHSDVVTFKYLENGQLKEKKVPLDKYLPSDLSNLILRHKLSLKLGFQIDSLFTPDEFLNDAPWREWGDLKNFIERKVREVVAQKRNEQVEKLNIRVSQIGQRRRVFYRNHDLGVEPQNEVETVLLFERFIRLAADVLPEGFFVKVLDYSPVGIDAICLFSPSINTPKAIVPVEFEFSLKSFFDHGHDINQVKLIICYKTDGCVFPYNSFGARYFLEDQAGISILKDNEGVQAYCLVLKNYLTFE